MLVSAGGRRTSPRVILAACRWGYSRVPKNLKKRTVNKGGFNLEEGEPEQQSYRFFSFGFTSKQKTRRCEKTENWDDYLRLECKGNTTVEGRTSCLSLKEDAHPRASSGGERFPTRCRSTRVTAATEKLPAVSAQGPKCDSLHRMMCMWRCESPRKKNPDRIVTLMMQAAHAQNPRVMRKGKKNRNKKKQTGRI